jgi:hypothetical protein
MEPIVTPPPGLYEDIAEHVYRQWDAVSQSTLKTFDRSAAHARHALLNPTSPPATDLGSAIHAVLLEPTKLEDRYAVRPAGIDGRTKEGKAALAAFRAENEGRIILGERDDFDTLRGVRDAVLDHPIALDLLTSPGFTEASFRWDDEGRACKGRADRIVIFDGGEVVVDVKSTVDASPRAASRAFEKFGYGVQAAYYLDGLDAIEPAPRRFFAVMVEKQAPYGIAIYEPDLVWLDYGRVLYRRWLAEWERCTTSGAWPSYPTGCQVLEAPEWVSKRLEVIG